MNEAHFQTADLTDFDTNENHFMLVDSNGVCFLVATAVKTCYGLSDTQ